MTVSLNGASGRQVSVDITTQSGSAQDGPDYTGTETAGPLPTIVFQPGQRTQVVRIPIINDPDVEPRESFTVRLGNAVNATLPATPLSATVNITSDDKPARSAVRSFVAAWVHDSNSFSGADQPDDDRAARLISVVRR